MPRKDGHKDRRHFHPRDQHQRPRGADSGLWLYGMHPVMAALANPRRKVHRAVLTERAAQEIGAKLLGRVKHEIADMNAIARMLPDGAVHQGVAVQVEKLPKLDLEDLLSSTPDRDGAAGGVAGQRKIVVVLDQISDPHNVGAILRSAAAFGASAVVVQDRHAPPESGVLAKSASGALDAVPYVEVVNISRALEDLGRLGFWRIALAGDGEQSLQEAAHSGDVAIVLGSEGSGIRRLVREHCDVAAFIPIARSTESLNVSNAAAVTLYELRRA
ncbi:MAG: 23S rRNA (guanosine(2251)-2'-O)-methyltransferase RlmB [Proteobacteria bacterium]|nr:23S rRNA (guanosine(2251)-2'-O)-methyltransferase RlmB [Pseudomonadota bacterium]